MAKMDNWRMKFSYKFTNDNIYDNIQVRIKNMDEKRATYISKYNKDNYKMYPFRVKKSDIKLIEKLDNISNRNSYLTNLILEDIEPSVLTIKQIKDIVRPILAKHNIKEAYLFGSYSRGEANRNSDVDIYCEEGDVTTLWKLSAFYDELRNALGKEVDIVTIDSEIDHYLLEQIEEDKIKIC